jgi:hypothetical protein
MENGWERVHRERTAVDGWPVPLTGSETPAAAGQGDRYRRCKCQKARTALRT